MTMAAGKEATETETASTAEAATIGGQRHQQWWQKKHRVNIDGNN
jgi:hypothetical protein